jgi:hypothetical protein
MTVLRTHRLKRASALMVALGLLLLACAAQASAAEVEWRQGSATLAEAIATKSSGTMTMTDEGLEGAGHPWTLECSATASEGLAGPGAADEEAHGIWGDECSRTNPPRCSVTPLYTLEYLHLPWKSELAVKEGRVQDVINGKEGKPGFKIGCSISGTPTTIAECTGTLEARVTNTVEGVSGTFDGEKLTCENFAYGKSSGVLKGSMLVEAAKGSKLDVARAVGWRQGGTELSKSIATKSKGDVKLTDESTAVSVECEGTGEGSAGAGSAGEVTKWTASKCTLLAAGSVCEKGKVAEIVATHLPWRSELVRLEGLVESPRDLIASSGKGAPGYEIECTVGGIFKTVDECTATALETAVANASGGVDATFDGEKLKCSVGGAGTGKLEGTQFIEAASGGTLEVNSPVWLQAGATLTKAQATKSTGTVTLTDEGAGMTFECEGTSEGFAGPGSLGEVTKWTASKCTELSSKTSCEKGKPVTLAAVHLPWRSELATVEGVTRDVLSEDGKGAPGYEFKCTVAGIYKVTDLCTATQLDTAMTNVTGGVDAVFDGEKLKCSVGGAGTGKLEGTQLLEATSGGKLEVGL